MEHILEIQSENEAVERLADAWVDVDYNTTRALGEARYESAREKIENLTKQYEADLKSMQEELQKKSEAYEKEQASLPANIKERREKELQDMYQKIQQSYQDNQQALAKEQSERMQAITTKVLDAIKQVGQSGGYVYIMDLTGGIPYISTTLSTDVTSQVKAKLGLK